MEEEPVRPKQDDDIPPKPKEEVPPKQDKGKGRAGPDDDDTQSVPGSFPLGTETPVASGSGLPKDNLPKPGDETPCRPETPHTPHCPESLPIPHNPGSPQSSHGSSSHQHCSRSRSRSHS